MTKQKKKKKPPTTIIDHSRGKKCAKAVFYLKYRKQEGNSITIIKHVEKAMPNGSSKSIKVGRQLKNPHYASPQICS